MSYTSFRRLVWAHYKKHGRHDLPWRHTRSPYHILVSELMLQQTQVHRVIPYYWRFIKKFPTIERLAHAPLSQVLKEWQGLGYNRRAQHLHTAAQEIVGHYRGTFPRTIEQWEALRGVGPYTARAVAAFAFNKDSVFIETNIRTVVAHHFFPKREAVTDGEIRRVLEEALPKGRAREWYSALMDYGAFLKQSGIKINAKSKHYTKQSTFAGSNREARGAILRELARGPRDQLLDVLGTARRQQVKVALQALLSEGLIQKRGRVYTLPR